LKPLYGMPSAARAWYTMINTFLEREGCETVGFEKSMWWVIINGHWILLGAYIDDFVIACAIPKASFGGIRGRIWRPLRTLPWMWNYPRPRRRHHYSLSKVVRRGDFAITWILGYSTAQHTYETQHSPPKRWLWPQFQTRLPLSLPWHCRKSCLPCHYDPPRFGLIKSAKCWFAPETVDKMLFCTRNRWTVPLPDAHWMAFQNIYYGNLVPLML